MGRLHAPQFIFWVPCVLVLGLLLGCPKGSGTGACDSTCSGCCDSAGACQSGTVISGCGRGASACVACGSGETCQLGSCVANSNDIDGGMIDGGTGDGGIRCTAGSCSAGNYCDVASGECTSGCEQDQQCPQPGSRCGATHQCECASGYHPCNGSCVSNSAITACGSQCSSCYVPANGSATCDGTSCGISCNPGNHRCAGSCSSNSSVGTCGTACSPCPVPTNGAATCSGTACDISCNAGYQRVGQACLQPDWFNLGPVSCSVGTPVGLLTAQSIKSYFAAASTGSELALVWKEGLSSGPLYFSIFDTTGTQAFTPKTVVVGSAAEKDAITVAVSATKVLIAWQSTSYTLSYAVYDTSGAVVSAPVSLGAGNYPFAVGNGAGFGLAWVSSSGTKFIRIDANGVNLNPTPVTLSGNSYESRDRPHLVWTGSEYGLTWRQSQNSYMYNEGRAYFARLDAQGATLTSPLDIGDPAGDPSGASYSYPAISFGGGNFAVAYSYLTDNGAGGKDHSFGLRVWSGATGAWLGPAQRVAANNPVTGGTSWYYPAIAASPNGFVLSRYWPANAGSPAGQVVAHAKFDGTAHGSAVTLRPGNQAYNYQYLAWLSGQLWMVAVVWNSGSDQDIWMAPITCTP